MIVSGYKSQPKFKEEGYSSKKNELNMWHLMTDLDKEEKSTNSNCLLLVK